MIEKILYEKTFNELGRNGKERLRIRVPSAFLQGNKEINETMPYNQESFKKVFILRLHGYLDINS